MFAGSLGYASNSTDCKNRPLTDFKPMFQFYTHKFSDVFKGYENGTLTIGWKDFHCRDKPAN